MGRCNTDFQPFLSVGPVACPSESRVPVRITPTAEAKEFTLSGLLKKTLILALTLNLLVGVGGAWAGAKPIFCCSLILFLNIPKNNSCQVNCMYDNLFGEKLL